MATQWCCLTWESLVPELEALKRQELAQYNVPASTFALVYKVLDQMKNCCPVCGESLNSEASINPPRIKREVVKEVPPPSPPVQKLVCPGCKGVGNYGEDARGIPNKCGVCLGDGFIIPKKNHSDVIAKADEMAEKLLRDKANQAKAIQVNQEI